jgi:hypothetical protein
MNLVSLSNVCSIKVLLNELIPLMEEYFELPGYELFRNSGGNYEKKK